MDDQPVPCKNPSVSNDWKKQVEFFQSSEGGTLNAELLKHIKRALTALFTPESKLKLVSQILQQAHHTVSALLQHMRINHRVCTSLCPSNA